MAIEGNRRLWVALGVLLLVVLLVPIGIGGMNGPGMMGWYGGQRAGGGWGWAPPMALGWLMMLASWGAAPRVGAGASAREVLQRRYASGEITREEYEEMRSTLA